MYNEQQQIIDGAYENYVKKTNEDFIKSDITLPPSYYPIDKDKFINKCKTDPEFSERWGLKIEERELSLEEKEWQLEKTHCINDIENDRIIYGHEWEKYIQRQYEGIQSNQGINIPTKLITITYNNKTIESYE